MTGLCYRRGKVDSAGSVGSQSRPKRLKGPLFILSHLQFSAGGRRNAVKGAAVSFKTSKDRDLFIGNGRQKPVIGIPPAWPAFDEEVHIMFGNAYYPIGQAILAAYINRLGRLISLGFDADS